jgi:hypothetical protein
MERMRMMMAVKFLFVSPGAVVEVVVVAAVPSSSSSSSPPPLFRMW